jgi:hypothetical protein
VGLPIPIGPGHDGNPFFSVPVTSGFVGSFELTPKGDVSVKPWANVDGGLGVVMVAGSGPSYHQAAGYDPHTAVCPDILDGSFSDRPQHFKTGEPFAHRIVLFFVEVTPKKTSTLSQSFSIAEKSGTPVLRFKLPEGGEAKVPLL